MMFLYDNVQFLYNLFSMKKYSFSFLILRIVKDIHDPFDKHVYSQETKQFNRIKINGLESKDDIICVCYFE